MSPDPGSVNTRREPRDRYLVGDGAARCLGVDLSSKVRASFLPISV